MAIAIPRLRAIVDAAVSHNPFVPTSSIESQCDILIVQPWWNLKDQIDWEADQRVPMKARILIIDGLDECSNSHGEWQRILSVLAQMVEKYSLPLHILVCSRPEPRIKETFSGLEFRNICRWMALDDTYQAYQDIRVFLVDGFQKVLARHSHKMEHIPLPWPTMGQIEYLVQKSSGQFIYPSMVLKYVDDDGEIPADRLNIVLGLHVENHENGDFPFADLDALYLEILSTVKNPGLIIHVLTARIALQEGLDSTWKGFIDLLGIPVGTLHAISCGIHSLFKGPSPVDSDFEFAHASFADFLLDRSRSMHFHVDKSLGHDYLAQRCLELYNETTTLRSYCVQNWAYHCVLAIGSEDLIDKLDSFPVYTVITSTIEPYNRFGTANAARGRFAFARQLSLIFQIWHKFQDKCGYRLQQYRDLSTAGFTVIVNHPRKLQNMQFSIPIQYPDSLVSTIAKGNSQVIIREVKNCLDDKIKTIVPENFSSMEICEIRPLSFTLP
ncbi:hypothetical protein GYMLUDRAFT_1000650 [Collybiopsis luxurians FD-317 M1]|uniref:Nephrocystin 3-like N-terminal domain-containing protein n=1 Tax=Collybiopsis luxurians FD-317 M1 TaxID=944289 RepID=A0A0D0CC50_9AGAR|nr:hypothetical protein GYMLUDRAFT_1000650 [Collybiopsis luxurians FD-317 M1]